MNRQLLLQLIKLENSRALTARFMWWRGVSVITDEAKLHLILSRTYTFQVDKPNYHRAYEAFELTEVLLNNNIIDAYGMDDPKHDIKVFKTRFNICIEFENRTAVYYENTYNFYRHMIVHLINDMEKGKKLHFH